MQFRETPRGIPKRRFGAYADHPKARVREKRNSLSTEMVILNCVSLKENSRFSLCELVRVQCNATATRYVVSVTAVDFDEFVPEVGI